MRRNPRKSGVFALLVLLALAGPASPLPLSVPGSGLPPLPGVGPTLDRVGNTVDTTLATVRRDLVGRPTVPARAFDRDENGARVVRREVLAVSPSPESLAIARAQGFEVLRSETLDPLGIGVTVLRPPSGFSAVDAVKTLRTADPAGTYEYDHIYDPSGDAARAATPLVHEGPALRAGTVGIVDGGIDLKHDAFDGADITTFNAASKTSIPTAHGTQVASLLIGSHGRWHGAARGAKLYAADVFGGAANGGSADAIARGLGWLAQNNVPVINVSLSGPPNALVGAAMKALVARGFIVVAAVGNDGPAVPVSFPAAYDGVVAVTAVDSAHKIQLDANRGPAVMFAATGVNVRAAKAGGGYTDITGTSFAAPIVAANFAALMAHPNANAARDAKAKLTSAAIDLGAPGRDPIYGYGFLAAPNTESETAAR